MPNQTILLTPDKQAWLMQHCVQASPTSLTIEMMELLARASTAAVLMPEMMVDVGPEPLSFMTLIWWRVVLFAMLNCASDMGATWKWQKLSVIIIVRCGYWEG